MIKVLCLFLEAKYGHTLWITDKGKIIDISNTKQVHWQWANNNRKLFKKGEPDDDIYSVTAKNDWIQVRNHIGLLTKSQNYLGTKKAFKKNKNTILKLIDEYLFRNDGKFNVDITYTDDEGNPLDRKYYDLPEDDNKIRREL